ncbi:MAG: hypothetical protein WB987_06515 [Candidatus Acidiferrales bacterium]
MLAVTFTLSCLTVFGFYAYVFVQFHREQRRLNANKKRLPEHLYEMEPEADRKESSEDREDPEFLSAKAATLPKADLQEIFRRETLIQVSLAVGGLVALYAGIAILNSLVTRLHWY